MTTTPHYLRFARALALLSTASALATSALALGCNSGSGGGCAQAGQPCVVTGPPVGCCQCVATGADGGPVLDGGATANGVFSGACGGPLAPPSLAA